MKIFRFITDKGTHVELYRFQNQLKGFVIPKSADKEEIISLNEEEIKELDDFVSDIKYKVKDLNNEKD